MSDAGEDEQEAFDRLVDSRVAKPVAAVRCCPTMDLLCFLSDSAEAWLQRVGTGTGWVRIHVLEAPSADAPPALLSCAWRPGDGRAVACGGDDGNVTIFDVESGSVLCVSQMHSSPVQLLEWVSELTECERWEEMDEAAAEAEEDFQALLVEEALCLAKGRADILLPALSQHPAPGESLSQAPATLAELLQASGRKLGTTSAEGRAHFTSLKQKTAPEPLSFLVSATAAEVALSAFGNFRLGSIRYEDISGLPNGTVCPVTALLSQDFQVLSMVLDVTAEAATVPQAFLSVFDTKILLERHHELRDVALEATSVSVLEQHMRSSLSQMQSKWKAAQELLHEKIAGVYPEMLAKDGRTTTLTEDLLSLLTQGVLCETLSRYLQKEVNLVNMTKTYRILEQHFSSMLALCQDFLQPATDAYLFRLGELLGLALCSERFGAIGLDPANANACIELAGAFLMLQHSFVDALVKYRQRCSVFFLWVTKMQFLLSPSAHERPWEPLNNLTLDEMLVVEFLEQGMASSKLDAFLDDSLSGSVEMQEKPLPASSGLSKLLDMQRSAQGSLPALLVKLQDATASLFANPSHVCSSAFKPLHVLPLSTARDTALPPPCLQAKKNEETGLLSQRLLTVDDDTLWLVEFPASASTLAGGHPFEVAGWKAPALAHVAPYTNNQVCVLTDVDGVPTLALAALEHELVKVDPRAWTRDLVTTYSTFGGEPAEVLELVAKRQVQETALLAVGEKRGLCCVVPTRDTRRVAVFDLEAEPEEEDEEDEEDEEEGGEATA